MNRSSTPGERSLSLFLLGLVMFSPPFLSIFADGRAVAGIPALFVYLYGAWGLLIALLCASSTPRGETLRQARRTRGARPESGDT